MLLGEFSKQHFSSLKHFYNLLFINSLNVGMFKVISIFQRMQSNHNSVINTQQGIAVQSYLNISKNAIKSQHAELDNFKAGVQSYLNISKNAIKSQPGRFW